MIWLQLSILNETLEVLTPHLQGIQLSLFLGSSKKKKKKQWNVGREYTSGQEKNEFFLKETDWKVEKYHLIYSYKWEEKLFRSFKK